jgi:hypothetical protein
VVSERFVILVRNPRTNGIIAVTGDDGESIAVFESEDDARDAAEHTTICQAWPYEIVEGP